MDPTVELRVQDALRRIESAQNELSRACADLSSVVGAMPEWKKAFKLSDSCKRFWHALHGKNRAKWKIDGFSKG